MQLLHASQCVPCRFKYLPGDPYLLTVLSVIGAVIVQLVLLSNLTKSNDITFDSWRYYLATQVVQNLSVITACVPYIKNFFLGLESGMIRIDDEERRRKMSTNSIGGSNSRTFNSRHKPSTGSARQAQNMSHAEPLDDLETIDEIRLTTYPFEGTETRVEAARDTSLEGRQQQHIDRGRAITATTEVSVEYGKYE